IFRGEGVALDSGRKLDIERVDVGKAAADDDGVGIEQIHHRGKRSREAVVEVLHRRAGLRVAAGCRGRDLRPGQATPAAPFEIRGKAGSTDPCFDAAAAAAIASWAGRDFTRPRRGQGTMTPFAGNAVRTGQYTPANADTAAAARTDDDTEYDVGILGCTVAGLRQGETVSVVRHADRPRDRSRQIAVERMADQTRCVRIFDQTCAT